MLKMNQNLITGIGIGIVFIGILTIIIGSLLNSGSNEKSNTKVAFGGVIGFIPFGFGNDKGLVIMMVLISVLFALFFYLPHLLK